MCYNGVIPQQGEKEMPKRTKITEEEVKEIVKAQRRNKNKIVDKWLEVLLLHAAGKSRKEISEKTGFKKQYITELVGEYRRQGLEDYTQRKQGGNRRNMTIEEETVFLSEFKDKAEKGQIVEVAEIEQAYQEKVGHKIGKSQIYRVLARHGWRKVMPRSKHPNKASDEAIEASKKLTLKSGN
jgi:transposase